MTSHPSVNFTPRMIFGNWLWPSTRRQVFCAPSISLNTMASAVLFERHSFERIVLCRTVAKMLSIGFDVRKCFQMFGREVVEGEQRVPVLLQAFDGLLIFDGIGLDEDVERRLRVLPRFGHPD